MCDKGSEGLNGSMSRCILCQREMGANDGLKTNDHDGIADIRAKPMESDEERPIRGGRLDPRRCEAAQDIELMMENKYLGFKSATRLKTIA